MFKAWIENLEINQVVAFETEVDSNHNDESIQLNVNSDSGWINNCDQYY